MQNVPPIKKIGKVGRQRNYEQLGIDDIEPVKEVIVFRYLSEQQWPGMSEDMQSYYDFWYFTAPNKRKDGKDHERHVKCWQRREQWIDPTSESATAPVLDSRKVLAYRKRSSR